MTATTMIQIPMMEMVGGGNDAKGKGKKGKGKKNRKKNRKTAAPSPPCCSGKMYRRINLEQARAEYVCTSVSVTEPSTARTNPIASSPSNNGVNAAVLLQSLEAASPPSTMEALALNGGMMVTGRRGNCLLASQPYLLGGAPCCSQEMSPERICN